MPPTERAARPPVTRTGHRTGSANQWFADWLLELEREACALTDAHGLAADAKARNRIRKLAHVTRRLSWRLTPDLLAVAMDDYMAEDGYVPCVECGSWNIEAGVCLDCAFEDDRFACPRCDAALDGRTCTDDDCGYVVPGYMRLHPPMFLSHYRCDECHIVWADEWVCACNDRCPNCRAEIEPWCVEDITPTED